MIDYNTILKDYYKAKDSQKQIEDLATNYQKERNERDAGLKTLVDSITALQKDLQDPALSDAKKKEKENQAGRLEAMGIRRDMEKEAKDRKEMEKENQKDPVDSSTPKKDVDMAKVAFTNTTDLIRQ